MTDTKYITRLIGAETFRTVRMPPVKVMVEGKPYKPEKWITTDHTWDELTEKHKAQVVDSVVARNKAADEAIRAYDKALSITTVKYRLALGALIGLVIGMAIAKVVG